jgi:ABC-2 type transport system permease protein
VLNLSPYCHLGAVPDAAPDWSGTVGMLTAAAVLLLSGLFGYRRRDLDESSR